jgi:succinate dehydrogenase / fumarate reductase membrane anchor subunit
MEKNYGSKRLVVGALMALFTIVLILQVLFGAKLGYERWSAIFTAQWMKVLTFVVIVAMLIHAWVGMRDIWMDYVKPVAAKLALQVFTLVWLVGCAGWAVQVLWRL